ncbi:EamA family transporter [Labrys monachus]
MFDGARAAGPRSQAGIAVLMAAGSMVSVQFGAALAKPAMDMFGTLATTWGRLAWAALLLAILVRPDPRRYGRRAIVGALALGVAIAVMTVTFYEAIVRVPLGLVVAIEFLGPLSVATFGFGRSWRLVWPLVALAGVLCLVRDREGWSIDPIGLGFALAAGVGWGSYILLSKRTGAAFKGLDGLAISFIAAALVTTPFGLAETGLHMPIRFVAETAGLALLTPLIPYALEMMALRRLPSHSFGILMSAEPAIGALAGFFILSQPLSLLQMAGIGLVIAASIGAITSASERAAA